MKNNQRVSFAYQEDGGVKVLINNFEIESKIRPGFYSVNEEPTGLFSSSFGLMVDRHVMIPKTAFNSVQAYLPVKDIVAYFSEISRKIHKDLGVKNKMGIIMHGKQGTGKTTMAYSMAEYLIKNHDAVAFTVNTTKELAFVTRFMNQINETMDEPILSVVIFDEAEHYMKHDESSMKNILDSSNSIDNCLMLFTTNYIDEIPEAIKDRPSRIKYSIAVEGIKDETEVFNTLMNINKGFSEEYRLTVDLVKSMVPSNVNKTLDELKHAIFDTIYKIQVDTKILAEALEEQSIGREDV